MLPSGETLVVVSAGFPAARYAVVHAYTRTCTPDGSFGDKGTEQLVLGGRDFAVSATAPAIGGGVLLAGERGSQWMVARIDQDGQLD
jgi:hypothetical protein